MMVEPALRPKIAMTDAPTPEMWNAIVGPLVQFNMARIGRTEIYCPLVITLSDPATDEIIGGLYGGTLWDYLRVDLLFVPEGLRGCGIGRQLMTKAEAEAVRRGCHGASLDTYSFQARGFYERLGYAVFGIIEQCPPGHRRFYLSKRLVAVEAISGAP
jgi:GNAT superfamily N-acetyltransferase